MQYENNIQLKLKRKISEHKIIGVKASLVVAGASKSEKSQNIEPLSWFIGNYKHQT
ncbi:hypothetical protein ABIC45_003477 [Mucilaginibacter rubeus]